MNAEVGIEDKGGGHDQLAVAVFDGASDWRGVRLLAVVYPHAMRIVVVRKAAVGSSGAVAGMGGPGVYVGGRKGGVSILIGQLHELQRRCHVPRGSPKTWVSPSVPPRIHQMVAYIPHWRGEARCVRFHVLSSPPRWWKV
jgi:hypothetical protein